MGILLMQTGNSITPTVKWAQRKDRIYFTIDAVEVTNPEIDIVNGRTLKFKGTTKDRNYEFSLDLYEEVNKEESKFSFTGGNSFLNVRKMTKGEYWPRITEKSCKLNWLQCDWGYYIDEEDEEEEAKTPDFGNEHSFPGFGGGDEMDDDDDMPTDMPKEGNGNANLDDLEEAAN